MSERRVVKAEGKLSARIGAESTTRNRESKVALCPTGNAKGS